MTRMTNASELTVRTWSATASGAGAADYSRYFAGTLLPQLRELPGFAGAYLLRRDLGQDGAVELTAHRRGGPRGGRDHRRDPGRAVFENDRVAKGRRATDAGGPGQV